MPETPVPSAPIPARPDFPAALRPAIDPGEPNAQIPLYVGRVDVGQGDKTFQAGAFISLDWSPSPCIHFKIPTVPKEFNPSLMDCLSLTLNDGTVISECLVTGLHYSMGQEGYKSDLSGIISNRVIRPIDAESGYAMFLVPNFQAPHGQPIKYPDGSIAAARLILRGAGWKITFDNVEKEKDVHAFLNANSGFGVTQVGRLEREDGKSFKANEALRILDALTWYISFTCGRWTGPCLPRGFKGDGHQIWEIWDYGRIVPYQKRLSWLDANHAEHFENPAAGFLRLWFDDTWQEVIQIAIHWYIEANAQAGSAEGSIVLTQTAFELLSSAVLVENYGWLSSDGYEKLSAADRIRLLFLWAEIPIAIPGELLELTKLAKADNWPDTSTAMTMIRNTITHPTRKNREKFGKHPVGARSDAWNLGLWNLELCLLRLFEYSDTYGSRLKLRYSGEVEPVPWATSGATNPLSMRRKSTDVLETRQRGAQMSENLKTRSVSGARSVVLKTLILCGLGIIIALTILGLFLLTRPR
jgi:hypothetical protein